MRQAGTIPDAALAERFTNYLVTLGISGRVEQTDKGFLVWVLDDRHWDRGREELAAFLLDPSAERYMAAQQPAEQLRREQRRRDEQYRRNIIDVRQRWSPWNQGRFPLTWSLIGISILLTWGTQNGKSPWAVHWLYMVPMDEAVVQISPEGNAVVIMPSENRQLSAILKHGQLWRLITPIFLQVGGMLHLLFNMMVTYQLGALIETRRGTLRLLGLVLIVAVCSNLAQFYYNGANFGGMSGVAYGLFGYAWMKSRFDPGAGIYVDRGLVFMFLLWLVLCMVNTSMPIANAAHAVGMISGMIVGYAPVLWRRFDPSSGG